MRFFSFACRFTSQPCSAPSGAFTFTCGAGVPAADAPPVLAVVEADEAAWSAGEELPEVDSSSALVVPSSRARSSRPAVDLRLKDAVRTTFETRPLEPVSFSFSVAADLVSAAGIDDRRSFFRPNDAARCSPARSAAGMAHTPGCCLLPCLKSRRRAHARSR